MSREFYMRLYYLVNDIRVFVKIRTAKSFERYKKETKGWFIHD